MFDPERSRGSRPERFIDPVRATLFWVCFFGLEIVCMAYQVVLIAVPCKLSSTYRRNYHTRLWNRLISFWGRNTCRIARVVAGMRLGVEGRAPEGRFVVVANHQSTMDIVVLHEVLSDLNLKFVVKKDLLRRIPVVSYALRDGGYGVVDFDNALRSLRDLAGFARGLEAWNGSAVIYPEGRRTFDGSIDRFLGAGIWVLVRESGLPVLPVVVDGLWRARSIGTFFVELPRARCRVSILPAIAPERAAKENFAAQLEEMMKAELARLRATGRSQGALR